MKRQKAQMFALITVLAVLAAAFFGLRQYNRIQAEKPEEDEEEIAVIDGLAEDVVALSFDYDGELCSFEKEDDIWYVVGDHSLKVQQSRIELMVEGVMPLMAKQVIENVTDLAQYGLTEPQQTITVETATASYILYVGDKNELTYSFYVCKPSTSTVYVVNSASINRFNYSLENLLETEEENED